ncbi:cytochrome d ubiquinol oxidase subunit II [Actinomycetes bacterium KLBMP 9797]
METAWYALLGLFFAAYLVLGGYDYGTGILLARARTAEERRGMLTAVGPFFLGNEVWLVATLGILFGAFPMLEGELLSGLYPAIAMALAGVLTVTVSVQLRSRPPGGRARHAWDRVIIASSVVAAFGWGAVLGGLLQGVPPADQVGDVITPFTVATGLTLVILVTVHGAAFLALRLPDRDFGRIGRRLIAVALTALTAATVVGLLSPRVRDAVQQPALAVLGWGVLVAALLVARATLGRRPGWAFTATSLALVAPVLLTGAAIWPYALVSSADPAASLTVADAAASAPTLRLLSWLAIPLVPALLGFQAMCWWAFRGRIDDRAPVYW